jgi:Uma2 family endonuclease
MIATRPRFGPADHGTPVTADELADAEYAEGYRYEVIDGRLSVAPIANLPEGGLHDWLRDQLKWYARARPDILNKVLGPARVFVPNRPNLTVPEPDVAAYSDFPLDLPVRDWNWEEVSPLVVCEVLVDSDPHKDLVRKVDLYFEVPSVAEYWILDGRADPDRPTLIARRRWGRRWVVRETPFGDTYTTRILPGFDLLIDPRT